MYGFFKFRRNLAEKYNSASLYFSQARIGKLGNRALRFFFFSLSIVIAALGFNLSYPDVDQMGFYT